MPLHIKYPCVPENKLKKKSEKQTEWPKCCRPSLKNISKVENPITVQFFYKKNECGWVCRERIHVSSFQVCHLCVQTWWPSYCLLHLKERGRNPRRVQCGAQIYSGSPEAWRKIVTWDNKITSSPCYQNKDVGLNIEGLLQSTPLVTTWL